MGAYPYASSPSPPTPQRAWEKPKPKALDAALSDKAKTDKSETSDKSDKADKSERAPI